MEFSSTYFLSLTHKSERFSSSLSDRCRDLRFFILRGRSILCVLVGFVSICKQLFVHVPKEYKNINQ